MQRVRVGQSLTPQHKQSEVAKQDEVIRAFLGSLHHKVAAEARRQSDPLYFRCIHMAPL